MTAFFPSRTRQTTWYTRLERRYNLEERYNLIEKTCLGAMHKIRRGDVSAFAAFAKNIGLLGSVFQNQARHTAGIKKKEYQEWKRAYRTLPQKVRAQAEAKLPF